MQKKSLGLYIHIPFCQKRCNYCGFLTFDNQADQITPYIEALCQEMALYPEEAADSLVDSIYFGGGTPSYIEAGAIQQIMASIRDHFTLATDCEISIEMNPESVSKERLQSYLEVGFNRFSMGVQSFNPEVLKIMGRLHDRESVLEKVSLFRSLTHHTLSLDMMFANPKQDLAILEEDISQVLALDPDHISYYCLMYKEGTQFFKWLKQGLIVSYEDEIDRHMYHLVQDRIQKAGYQQYEISNFARPGSQSRHNQKYWRLDNYLGLGLGASGNLDLFRYSNTSSFQEYYKNIKQGHRPIAYEEHMDMEEREKEFIILNLRLTQGFKIEEINDRFQIDFMKKYEEALSKHLQTGLIQIKNGRLAFTRRGLDIGDQFYLDII